MPQVPQMDRASPFISPTASDDADDGNAGHFTDDVVRDDDSLRPTIYCCTMMM